MPTSPRQPQPPDAPPPGDRRKWWVLAAVGAGTFMSALNSSIVNAVVPLLMQSLGIELGEAEWVTLVFLLIVSGLLLGFGRLGDMVGHKRIYLAGFAVFLCAAIACGFSGSLSLLVGARAVQAVGAAMLLSSSPALITAAFPARQRGQALGLQGAVTYLGTMSGPTIGGWIAERAGWPSVFFACVPAGVAAMALAAAFVSADTRRERREPFDLTGAALFLAGFGPLLLALSHGEVWGWSSPLVLGLLAGSIALLAAFVETERRSAHPMIDLRLFQVRIVRAAAGSAVLANLCLFAVMFLVPFYLLRFRAMSPSDAGLLLSAQALAMALTAPFAGWISDRIGSRLPSSVGMAIVTAGLLSLASLDGDATRLEVAARLALLGLGSGLFASPNNSALLGAVPRERHGVAAGVLASARNVGMVLGVALAGAVFARGLAAQGGNVASAEAFMPAFRITFLVIAAFGVLGTVVSLTRGARQPAMGPRPL